MNQKHDNIFRSDGGVDWLAVAAKVNARLGTKYSGNYLYQIHTGRQASETVRLAIMAEMERERKTGGEIACAILPVL